MEPTAIEFPLDEDDVTEELEAIIGMIPAGNREAVRSAVYAALGDDLRIDVGPVEVTASSDGREYGWWDPARGSRPPGRLRLPRELDPDLDDAPRVSPEEVGCFERRLRAGLPDAVQVALDLAQQEGHAVRIQIERGIGEPRSGVAVVVAAAADAVLSPRAAGVLYGAGFTLGQPYRGRVSTVAWSRLPTAWDALPRLEPAPRAFATQDELQALTLAHPTGRAVAEHITSALQYLSTKPGLETIAGVFAQDRVALRAASVEHPTREVIGMGFRLRLRRGSGLWFEAAAGGAA